MKTPLMIAASAVAACAALPAAAQSVEVRDAVARVVVIPEDRSDIAVEIEPGRAGLPALRVARRGADVRIFGELGRNPVRQCRAGPPDARQPGEGASVEVRGYGRVDLADAPLIVLRTPRDVDVSGSGAVFGSVGRGARSLELGSGGCGSWTVANVDGPARLSIGGSGAIRAGSATELEIRIGGSGSVAAASARSLEAAIGGSGDIVVQRIDGPVDASIGGSGDVRVRGGEVTRLTASIAGSGNVVSDVPVREISASLVGSGSVRAPAVSGNVSQSSVGSGRVVVGR